jgi:CHAT domain/Lecithin:cholesterol acyltransferase
MRPMADVVVLLPGITGSVLRDNRGRDLWAPTAGGAARALVTLGRSITDLELRDENADDGVTAPMMIPDLHLIPGLWKIDGYSTLSAYLQRQFAVTPGRNFFTFPYDWRRDNRVAARRLKEQTDRWLWEWRQEVPEAKLILVGHSMGGLVARYFLECLEGWRDTRRLVTFGTPYRGSLNALNFLVHGMRKQLGPVPVLDLSRLLRSFPSIYQLLPIYPCLDPGDGMLIRISEAAGLPDVDSGRAQAADAFHREIERAVTAHLDDEEYRRARYTIHPIVGTFQATLLSARRSGNGVEALGTYPGFAPDGDGTVPRVSATPIEFPHEEGAMFAAERHGSLQHNDGVLVQLTGLLSEQDTSMVRAGADAGLELDDAYGPAEPVTFRYRAADPMAPLTAVIADAETGAEFARLELGAAGEWRSGELAPPAPGAYRITLGGEGVGPVTDTFMVVGEQDPTETDEVRTRGRLLVRGGEPETMPSEAEPELLIAPTPDEAGSPVPERRFLQGRFPERVRLGEEVTLLVRFGLQPGARLEAPLRPLAVPAAGLDVVLLLVESPGFTLRSPERQAVHVVPRQDSDWAAFELQAAWEGVHTLQVEAFVGGAGLGGLAVQVSVDAAARTGPSVERSAPAGIAPADPGEVSLLLSYDPGQQVYRYRLLDSGGYYSEEAASDRLLQPPDKAIEQLVAQLNVLARGQAPWDAATTRDWLKGQGIALWNSFIPQALQREFWQRRDRITQMTIVSQGDPVPWELLYPFAPGGQDAGFLIDQFPVARRRYGPRPPRRLQLRAADLVLSGDGSLAAAPAEIAAVDGLLRDRGLAARRIGDLPALLQAFQRGDIGLLHFSCHNAFTREVPNASRILLASQPFEPVFLEQYAGRFAGSLVFLNACRTDGQAPLYTTVEGWAASFLRAGAGAFIGSLWEVTDTSASTYAQEFYQAVLTGDTLGAAARKARAAVRGEHPGDPTWLAYTLYGNPRTTVSIEPQRGG